VYIHSSITMSKETKYERKEKCVKYLLTVIILTSLSSHEILMKLIELTSN